MSFKFHVFLEIKHRIFLTANSHLLDKFRVQVSHSNISCLADRSCEIRNTLHPRNVRIGRLTDVRILKADFYTLYFLLTSRESRKVGF